MKKIRVGVCGASGYGGVELLRLIARHPGLELAFITSESQSQKTVGEFEPSLTAYRDVPYVSIQDPSLTQNRADAVFLSLPHEASAEAAPKFLDSGMAVIDLSAAFRIRDLAVFEKIYQFRHPSAGLVPKAVYGLCETNRDAIRKADLVANPGCYPTSVLLPLIPLLKKKVIRPESVIIDSKSGFTGRGRKTDRAGLFGEMNENTYAYGVGTHRHRPEIAQELDAVYGKKLGVTFTPHILPVDRGILSTIYVYSREDCTAQVLDSLDEFYAGEPFVNVYRNNLPQMKWVAHTNDCSIGAAYDAETQQLVIVSVIDNLVKGAAGQAVQCLNIRFGLPETDGLQ